METNAVQNNGQVTDPSGTIVFDSQKKLQNWKIARRRTWKPTRYRITDK